jgi:hypothetical protein
MCFARTVGCRAIFFLYFLFLFACREKKIFLIAKGECIPLTASSLVNESARGNASHLVDEQSFFQDTLRLNENQVQTFWYPSKIAWYYPVHTFIDLGGTFQLSGIYLYHGDGDGKVTISTGQPFVWKEKFSVSPENENCWSYHGLGDTTRYVRITLATPAALGEIILTGKKLESNAPIAENFPAATTRVSFDLLMGVNGFIDDPLEEMRCVSRIREYHNWYWDEGNQWEFGSGDDGSYPAYPNNRNRFQPSYAGNNRWFFDDYYLKAKESGLNVSPVLTGSVDWLSNFPSHKPVPLGLDPELPASYSAHADHMYQFVSRYGSEKKAQADLKLAPGQPAKTGLNLLHYIENWNEEDAWWDGRAGYFTPYEFAAMSSADYDGHLRSLGNKAGVKNADRGIKMVLGGLAYLNLDYLKAMKTWCEHHRKGSMPFDVINVHHYCNANEDENTKGISPEEDSLKEKIEKLVKYRNLHFPGKEIWVSEFGYDTHPESVQGVPEIGHYSREEVQAQWIFRSYLALAAAGVDAAYLYMFRDVDPESKTKYATSGLTLDPSRHWEKKTSWYYVNALKHCLKGFCFYREEKKRGANIYTFIHKDSARQALAVWLPSSVGGEIKEYALVLPGSHASAKVITFKKGYPLGISKIIRLKEHILYLEVSEDPKIVLPSD